LESIIGDTIVESLVAIELKKITSNYCKYLETMVINLWDLLGRTRRNNNFDPIQHIREIQSCGVKRPERVAPYHSSKDTIEE
jgi:hypothetical protein